MASDGAGRRDGSRAAQAAQKACAYSQLLLSQRMAREGQARQTRRRFSAALLTSFEQHAVRIEDSRMFVRFALAVAHDKLEAPRPPMAASFAHCQQQRRRCVQPAADAFVFVEAVRRRREKESEMVVIRPMISSPVGGRQQGRIGRVRSKNERQMVTSRCVRKVVYDECCVCTVQIVCKSSTDCPIVI